MSKRDYKKHPVTVEELTASVAELSEAVKEMRKEGAEYRRESERMRQENAARDRKYERKLREQAHRNAEEWGKLAEYLSRTGLKELINHYTNIEIDDLVANVEVVRGDKKGEIDIIAIGKRDVVVVETKTTLRSNEVKSFKKKYLPSFPYWRPKSKYIVIPDCRDKRVFGCVTFLKAKHGAEQTALDLGLLVVRTLGKKIQLINPNTALINYNTNSQPK